MPPKTLREVLKTQKKSPFIGRDSEKERFRENLAAPFEERRYVWAVSGQGGVGKTWLLRAYQRRAEAHGWRTAWTGREHANDSIPEVLHTMATSLAGPYQAKAFTDFNARYDDYETYLHAVESDPKYLEKFGSLTGGLLGRIGVAMARQTAVEDWVEDSAGDLRTTLGQAGGELGAFIARKLGGKKEDIQLVRDPVGVLTPLFLAGLLAVAEVAPVALFFDEYENRSKQLDRWLRALLGFEHGDLPADSLLVIGGRDELDRNAWSDFEDLIERVALEQFSEDEAQAYLAERRIDNPAVVDLILELSGRLPLLMATLAVGQPSDPQEVGDATGTAVERFLRWVEDPEQRELALRAALPRVLDRDIVKALVASPDRDDVLFDWLIGMPFVSDHADGWIYHEVVRSQMLGFLRRRSLADWSKLHTRLADLFANRRGDLEDAEALDVEQQRWHVEHVFHYLCSARSGRLEAAARFWLDAEPIQTSIGAAIDEAGQLVADDELRDFGSGLVDVEQWKWTKRSHEGVTRLVALVPGHYEAIDLYGVSLALRDRWAEALASFREAIRLKPEVAYLHFDLSLVYFKLGDLGSAESSLLRALDLEPVFVQAQAWLGTVLAAQGDLRGAESAYRLALEIDPENVDAHSGLAKNVLHAQGDLEGAESHFRRALELDPKDAAAYNNLGFCLYTQDRLDEAEPLIRRALEFDSESGVAHDSLGCVLHKKGRHEEAEAAFRRAVELEPNHAEILHDFGTLLQDLDRPDEAIEHLRKAHELDPDKYPDPDAEN